MAGRFRSGNRETIRDQAAGWSDALRHKDGDECAREDFERWYADDPRHAQAFDRIDAVHRTARAASGSEAMAAVERETLQRVAARRNRGRRRGLAVAASLFVAVTVGLLTVDTARQELDYLQDRVRYALAGETLYRTSIGEQLRITLEDGTVLTLNTDSRAVEQYDEGERAVTLLEGQAFFEVASNRERPFVVTAGSRRVRAIGTAFDVRLSEDRFEVALLEGRIAIEEELVASPSETRPGGSAGSQLPEAAPDGEGDDGRVAGRAFLSPGEQFTDTLAAAGPVIREVDVSRVTSWRDGQLTFRNDRLDEAVSEVNRYSRRKIVLADDDLGTLRVSGIVNTGNTAVFVETMASYYPIRIVEQDRERIILGAR